MRVLALDTTTRAGSVAIVDGDCVVDERPGDASRTHAERMPAEILALLTAHHRTLADVDVFAVASGPGSFTGLRIGIATIQGLAFVGRQRIVPIAALDVLAHLASRDAQPGDMIGAWMDAHRRDVFASLYRVGDAPLFDPERLVSLDAATVDDPAKTIARWQALVAGELVRVIGDGAVLFADVIAREARAWRVLPAAPLAGALGRLAVARARRGACVDPAGLQPLYIRRPDAEVARDRRVAD
jgi:tRNA threonylcarbamoyladenosine biosynthesis protein TsaB